jgi:hypothetical protein
MLKFVELVSRLKNIDYSKVDKRKREVFVRMEAKSAGATNQEAEVILQKCIH